VATGTSQSLWLAAWMLSCWSSRLAKGSGTGWVGGRNRSGSAGRQERIDHGVDRGQRTDASGWLASVEYEHVDF
jgi:hypothetical protein